MPFPRKRHSRTTNRDVFLSLRTHLITKSMEGKEKPGLSSGFYKKH